MLSRQQRRAAERAAQKQARREAQVPQNSQPDPARRVAELLTTNARLAANRANAQLSTGPKTEEGKTKSSQNSFKHGLYSKQLVIPGEDPAELDALRSGLLAEHQPATETEALLVNEMADQYWRLRRCRRYETTLLHADFNITHMNAVHRMMTSAERGFHKSLVALTKLQKARGFVCGAGVRPATPDFEPASLATGSVPQNPAADEAALLSEPKIQADEAALLSEPKIQADEAALLSQPKTNEVSVRKSAPAAGFVSQISNPLPAEEDLNDPAILEKDRNLMRQLWSNPRFSKAPTAA